MTGGIRHRLAIAVIFCWAIPVAGQCPAVSAPTGQATTVTGGGAE